jgi:hypothetical protein
VKAAKALELLRPPYSLLHQGVSGGTDVGSSSVKVTLISVPGLADGVYLTKRHRIEKQVTFGEEYVTTPSVWGRGVSTAGYSAENPNYVMGWCQPVAGTVTPTGCTFVTYMYEVFNALGQFVGWCPCRRENVSMKYTVHGILMSDVGIGPMPEKAGMYELYVPQPNPFNPSTLIRFRVAGAEPVSLRLYEVRGRIVKTFYGGALLPMGEHHVWWDGMGDRGTKLSSGIYFLELGRPLCSRCAAKVVKVVKLD